MKDKTLQSIEVIYDALFIYICIFVTIDYIIEKVSNIFSGKR